MRGHIPDCVIVTAHGSTNQGSGEEKSVQHGDAEEGFVERKINAGDIEDNNPFMYLRQESITSNVENWFALLPHEDQELIKCASTEMEKRWSTEGIDIYSSVIPFKFSDDAFEQFKEHAIAITGKVDFSRLTPAHWLKEKGRFVKVGSNMVYPELVPLYHQLIDKQGDFTAGCPLCPFGKARLLMLLLMLIQSTQGRQICEMTGDLLCSLQIFLEFISGELGFDFSVRPGQPGETGASLLCAQICKG